MTDSFPRQQARTRNFTLGAPRSFQVSPDGGTVAFLRSPGGTDPVTALWALDVAPAPERLIADPARLAAFGAADDELEKARRERVRERAAASSSFATDAGFTVAAFALAGRVYLAGLAGGPGGHEDTVTELATRTPFCDPRPDPSGRLVAYTCAGALRVLDTRTGEDHAVVDPDGAAGISFGLAEFVAAEEMGRTRGYWWSPDGAALLVARVDENPVQRWYIADPANPDRRAGRSPTRPPERPTPTSRCGSSVCPEADAGRVGRARFEYLVTARWADAAPARGGAEPGPAPHADPQSRPGHRARPGCAPGPRPGARRSWPACRPDGHGRSPGGRLGVDPRR